MPTTAPIAAFIPQQFLDADGQPLALGRVYTYAAGTTTPLQTYASADLDPLAVRTNPILLGDDGRPEDGLAIYVLPQMYKWAVHDEDDVLLYTVDDQGDRGYIFAANYGSEQAEGSTTAHVSPYTVLASDRLVRVDSTAGAFTLYLPPASDYALPLVIKNMAANTVAITPHGTDTIEGVAAAYTLPAGVVASKTFPTVTLVSNGTEAWWIIGSHKA